MRHTFTTVLAALGMAAALAAHAEVYEWQDKSGKTHYGDRPPVDSQTADTVDGVGGAKKGTGTKSTGKGDDDPRARAAQELERNRKQAAKSEREKKVVAWRCDEMVQQRATAQEQYDKLLKTDPKKAAVLKTDIENYDETMGKICK